MDGWPIALIVICIAVVLIVVVYHLASYAYECLHPSEMLPLPNGNSWIRRLPFPAIISALEIARDVWHHNSQEVAPRSIALRAFPMGGNTNPATDVGRNPRQTNSPYEVRLAGIAPGVESAEGPNTHQQRSAPPLAILPPPAVAHLRPIHYPPDCPSPCPSYILYSIGANNIPSFVVNSSTSGHSAHS